MNERNRIMKGIIKCGGLYGQIAARLEAKNEDRFITECFEQCHNQSVHDLWGKELVMAIISYRLNLIRIPLKQLMKQEHFIYMRT